MATAADRRRRVLLVTVEFGAPPVSGRERRYGQHVAALRSSSEVGVLVLDRGGRSAGPPPPGLSWWHRTAVRWLDDQVQWLGRPDGHPSYGQLPPAATSALDASLQEFEPDVVVVAGLWLHGYLDRLGARGRYVILDAADVEGPLSHALADIARPGERTVRRTLARHVAEIERRAVASVDQVWACSESDAHVIRSAYPETAPVMVVPNTVDTEALRRPPDMARPGAPTTVYTATFGYAPNHVAAMALVHEVQPLVRRRFPPATLNLVGRDPSPELEAAAASTPGVTVTGTVADPRPWLWGATAQAVPLQWGSGTRIKILESMAAGLPVVTTDKGLEGLDAADGEHVVVARSPEQFADAIAWLHQDREAATALAVRARDLVEARYSTEAARRAIETALARLPARTP